MKYIKTFEDNSKLWVQIKIEAEVGDSIDLSKTGESLEDVKNRKVDIYLHGPGENGHHDKEDYGVDSYEIVVADVDKNNKNKIIIHIKAEVTATLDLYDYESVKSIESRYVDIYFDENDLGVSKSSITILKMSDNYLKKLKARKYKIF